MLTIKEEYFRKILNDIKAYKIGFDAEGGCACGRIEIELGDNLFLSVYRSCRKSGSAPNNKLWNIEEIEFYPKPYDTYYDHNEVPQTIDIRLNNEQEIELINILKLVSTEIWGEEYR